MIERCSRSTRTSGTPVRPYACWPIGWSRDLTMSSLPLICVTSASTTGAVYRAHKNMKRKGLPLLNKERSVRSHVSFFSKKQKMQSEQFAVGDTSACNVSHENH
jgi:hypothetical protein